MMFSCIFCITDLYKTQEICDRITFEDPFSIRYVRDQYKTQQMYDEAVDYCLAVLKFVPDWIVASKMSKRKEMDIFNTGFHTINLGNRNYDEDDTDTVIIVRLDILNFKNAKHLKNR